MLFLAVLCFDFVEARPAQAFHCGQSADDLEQVLKSNAVIDPEVRKTVEGFIASGRELHQEAEKTKDQRLHYEAMRVLLVARQMLRQHLQGKVEGKQLP